MTLKTAARGIIPPFIVMEVLRRATELEQAGHAVRHLEVGQPSTGAPRGVIEAAKRALDADRLGYTEALGIRPLREAIAQHYADQYDVTIPAARIVVTTGSSGGFVLSFLAAFDPGDRVALASPGYPCYRHILTGLGIEPVLLEAGPAERYQPNIALLEKAEWEGGKLDGLILASPSNPTGTMVTPEELQALADYCHARGIRLISDEIYHGIGYGTVAEATAAAFSDSAVVINSFSKYFSMTGWRLGWMVVPEDLARAIECLAQNLFINAPTLSQIAGIAAFDCREELDGHVANYARSRAHLMETLPAAGISDFLPPDGAFYIYADISRLTNDSRAFCAALLEETGVACTPGMDFDEARGAHTMRFSFARKPDEIEDASGRLADWLKHRGQ